MKRLLAAPRRVLIIGALAAVAVVVAAGYGYAAVTADNQTYTGCLVTARSPTSRSARHR